MDKLKNEWWIKLKLKKSKHNNKKLINKKNNHKYLKFDIITKIKINYNKQFDTNF